MTFDVYFRTLRRGWLTLTAGFILGAVGGLVLSAVTPATYAATNEVFVSVQASTASNSVVDVGQGDTAAQQKVQSYVNVVTSSRVLEPVIDELKLDTSVPDLAGDIMVSTPRNSVIIAIRVTDGSAAGAARIADAVAKSFRAVVVDQLEARASDDSSLIRIETLEPAQVDSSPVAPRPAVNFTFGCAIGLVLGAIVVLLRSVLDTRIRNESDVEAVTRLPIIGTIGFDREAREKPLIVHLEPNGHRSEAFRALRTNLKFVDAGKKAFSFVVTSALPAESKTTTAANLAITIAESGAKVVVIDADLRRPRLADAMGVEGAVGLTDVLIGHAEVDDVMQPWGRQNMMVMPAGQVPPNPSELLGSFAMQALLAELAKRFDHVIFDSPPLLPVTDAAVLSRLTDGAVFVTASGRSRRAEAEQALAQLDHIGSRVLGVVLSMIPLRDASSAAPYATYYADMSDAERVRGRLGRRRRRARKARVR